MANIAKIGAERLAPIYDEKRRPSEDVTNKDELKMEGQNFETYSPKENCQYRFESFEDMTIKKQQVREGSKAYQFLVSCEVSEDGGKTWIPGWFSLNHLSKRDAKNEAVHPTWYALGNMYARAKRLAEIGLIKVGKKRSIDAPEFTQDGNRKTRFVLDTNNKPVLNEDGTPRTEYSTVPQDVFDITPAA